MILAVLFIVVAVAVEIALEESVDEKTRSVAWGYLLYGLLFAWSIKRLSGIGISIKTLLLPSQDSPIPWSLIALAVPLVILAIGLLWLLYAPLSFVFPGFVQEVVLIDSGPTWNPGKPAASSLDILMGVVVAPVVEEILFRGVILHRWAYKWGINRAVVYSSLAFAFIHIDLIGAFIFGFVMAALYFRTKTLLVPIACHALHNAVTFALEYLPWPDNSASYGVVDFRADWWIGALCLTVAMPTMYVLRRKYLPVGDWRSPLAKQYRTPRLNLLPDETQGRL